MREINNIKIIGVDAGYGNIKTANTVTPTGITACDTQPIFNGSILEYESKYYRIGEGHKEFISDKVEDDDFYLDLVFYHSILKCHVLIDLKIGKLTHSDVGQMDSYIRMFDALYKSEDDNPTIGVILCSQKNEAIVKYSVLNEAKQVFASKYRLTLPSAEELQREIEEERRIIEKRNNTEN